MKYALTQLKRSFIAFPKIFLSNFIIFGIIAFALFSRFSSDDEKENYAKVKIGIIGEDSSGYFNMGISTLKNLDDLRFSVDFIKMENEPIAKKMLDEGKLSAYAIIPDDYINSLIDGRNYPVTVFFRDTETSIVTIAASELLDCVSALITETEIAIYTYHDLYTYFLGKRDAEEENLELALNIKFLKKLLARGNLFNVTEINTLDAIQPEIYYLCVGFLLLMFFWGLGSVFLFIRSDDFMQKMLYAKGMNVFSILFSEWISCFLLMFFCFIPIFIFAPFFFDSISFTFILSFLPAMFLCVNAELLVAEFCHDIISAIALHFTVVISVSYISGFFYPIELLPKQIAFIGKFLPCQPALKFSANILKNRFSALHFFIVIFYSAILFLLAAILKHRRIQKNG